MPSCISAFLRRFSYPALALCFFCTIWGTKLAVIDRYGSDLPFWDQLAKESDFLLTPFLERHELWSFLVLPHNEHRIAPTLSMNLVLAVAGGQWDARVQCAASAALHAALATGLFLWLLSCVSFRWALAAGSVIILATAPPIVWENVLGGFQSQFYFLAGFSLLSIYWLLGAPAFGVRWCLGLLSGLLALVSMGSGLLVAVPLAAIGLLRLCDKVRPKQGPLLLLLAGLLLGGFGAYLRTPTPWHDALKAHGVGEFLLYAGRCMSWPLTQYSWLALLFWAPWFALLLSRLKALRTAAGTTKPAEDFALGAGLWVLLQIAAVSFSRAGEGSMPSNRYGDICGLGLILSFAALALLAPRLRSGVAASLGLAWVVVAAVCLGVAGHDVFKNALPGKKADNVAYERSVQAFILTDDYETFSKARIPFPFPDWLARILRRPEIRAKLPVSVRAPVQVEGLGTLPCAPAPSLQHRRIRVLAESGEWTSPLVGPGQGWWKIETTGPAFADLKSAAAVSALQLTSVTADGALSSETALVAPSRPSVPDNWRAAYVPAPKVPSKLVARAQSPNTRFGFSEPIEMSTLSYRCWQVTKQGMLILLFGLSGFIALMYARSKSV